MGKGISEQQKLLILAGIIGVLLVWVGYQFVWRPFTAKSGTARPKIAKMRADLENAQRQVERLPELGYLKKIDEQAYQRVKADHVIMDWIEVYEQAKPDLDALPPAIKEELTYRCQQELEELL